MAKRRRTKTKNKKKQRGKGALGGFLVALCLIGIMLIYLIDTKGELSGSIKEIFQNTLHNITSFGEDITANDIANLDTYGDKLIIYAVDTGNSDCIIIRTPEEKSMIVDAADSDDLLKISSTLKSLGISQLNAAVATHPDADHIGSMGRIVEAFKPGVVYMPDFKKNTATYKNLMASIEKSGSILELTNAPYSFALGSLHSTVLNPQQKEYDSANEASIVLLLEYGNTRALLTGDIETEALADVLSIYGDDLDVDVLKIAHHGSARSTTQALLDATTPDIAVINAGIDNSYGHPHRETIELLQQNDIRILRTDLNGDIALFSDGSAFQYSVAS